MSYSTPNLSEDYLKERNSSSFRGHTSPVHPLYKKEFENGTNCIKSFLEQTILAQAKYKRYSYLYNLSAEKCFNNNSNNYFVSEALECEKLIFKKDPVLANMDNFLKHFEVSMLSNYENSLKGITCAKIYLNTHKENLLKMNFLYRYYYYFYAKSIFLNSWSNKNMN